MKVYASIRPISASFSLSPSSEHRGIAVLRKTVPLCVRDILDRSVILAQLICEASTSPIFSQRTDRTRWSALRLRNADLYRCITFRNRLLLRIFTDILQFVSGSCINLRRTAPFDRDLRHRNLGRIFKQTRSDNFKRKPEYLSFKKDLKTIGHNSLHGNPFDRFRMLMHVPKPLSLFQHLSTLLMHLSHTATHSAAIVPPAGRGQSIW